LKSQLDSKEMAKVESLVKINDLRKQAKQTLRLQPLENENQETQISSMDNDLDYDEVRIKSSLV